MTLVPVATSVYPIYVQTERELYAGGSLPEGYFSAGVMLPENWSAFRLGILLNSLYAGVFRDEPFLENNGARSFTFFGERATDAHALCDAFRMAWTHNQHAVENIVCTMGEDGDSVDDFVTTVVLASSAPGQDAYADNFRYHLIVAPDDGAKNLAIHAVRALLASFKEDGV